MTNPEPGEIDLGLFMVGADESVREVMLRLGRNGQGMAAVIEADGQVAGVVIDSMIRRAVLDGHRLDRPVREFVLQQPSVASMASTDEEIRQILHSRRLRAIPVVDEGRLVGVRTIDDLDAARTPPVAVIMAGGRGQRLRPLTDKVPKPLLKIGATSIIERIIVSLAAAGIQEVFLSVNYKAEIFEERLGSGDHLGVTLHYLHEKTEMGTAGGLSLLPTVQEAAVVVVNGDIVTTVDFARLLDFHWRFGGVATVAAVEHLSRIPYGVVRTVEHHLLAIEEKPTRSDLCSAGICVLEPQALQLVPRGQALDMPELVSEILAEGLPVSVFPILEKWFDIGGTEEFERVLVQFSIGEEE